MKKLVIIFVFSIFLNGCVTHLPQQPISESEKSKSYTTHRSAIIDKTDATTKHLDADKNILYTQNFGGPGAVAGILFGPLGAAANMGIINEETKKDVALLTGKIKIDPKKVFEKAVKNTELSIMDGEISNENPNVSPYISIVKRKDDKLYITAALLFELGTEKEKKWVGRYFYQLPVKYSFQQIESGDPAISAELEEEIINGYIELVKFHRSENLKDIATETKIKIKSDLITPRITYELMGQLSSDTGDRIWIRFPFSVHSLTKSDLISISTGN